MRSIVVDGVEIPEALIAQEVQNHPSASAREASTAAGHALAIRALLLDRATQIGLQAEPETDADGREETIDEAVIRALLDHELEIATPTEAECRRIYDAERHRFHTPAMYEASHILISASDAGAATAARLIEAQASGTATFTELALQHSDCPSAKVGGSLGQLVAGDLVPELEHALSALEPGEVAGRPVRSRFGWHILRLDRRIEGRELPFEMVEDQIRLHLESRAWTAAAVRYVADLTAAARARGVAIRLTLDGEVARGSMTFGDFLSDSSAAMRLEPWLRATDPALLQRLAKAANAVGETLAEFVRAAVADFIETADDERWTNLISAVRDAEDPTFACLATVLRSKLDPAQRSFTVIRRP